MQTKENSIILNQDLVEIKSQISIVEQSANNLKVENQKDMNKATDVLHNVRMAEKYITEKKTEITGPLMKSLASIRDLFKPLETSLQLANKTIKEKMLAWQIAEDERVQKEKDRITKRVEKGTMKAETAAGKLETLGDAPVKSSGEVGKSTIREVKKVRIIDESIIPREYLIPNMTAITEAVIRKGAIIPGIETYVEKSIVSR